MAESRKKDIRNHDDKMRSQNWSLDQGHANDDSLHIYLTIIWIEFVYYTQKYASLSPD